MVVYNYERQSWQSHVNTNLHQQPIAKQTSCCFTFSTEEVGLQVESVVRHHHIVGVVEGWLRAAAGLWEVVVHDTPGCLIYGFRA
jgi:hypothetical protein